MTTTETKTETKHTPGPWSHACDSGHSSPCLGKTLHSRKACVYVPDTMKTIASHVEWPNARLIAAAPELLELVDELQATVRALTRDVESCDLPNQFGAVLCRADAAIAKATGQN